MSNGSNLMLIELPKEIWDQLKMLKFYKKMVEKLIFFFFPGLVGIKESNEAEVILVIKFKAHFSGRLIIESDSKNSVKQALKTGSTLED